MPQASRSAWPTPATRALVAVFATALLFTASAGLAASPAAAQLGDQIASARRSQLASERLMLRQDRVIERLKRQRRATTKKWKRAQRIARRSRRGHAASGKIVRVRARRLAQAEARFADPSEAPNPTKWRAKMRRLNTELRVAVKRRQAFGSRLRSATRARKAKFRQRAQLRRQMKAAVRLQRSAEGALGARIVQMTRLAQQRANLLSSARLGDRSTFTWPSVGRVTQSFGCTGVRSNSRRGSCRYFHRGMDIVSGYASPVKSAAMGVVAYVGWNPWDERGRAFIVVVSHPDGYITRYGHVVASRRVRTGQVVRKGQTIARMGNTGFSTGTHVHVELLKGSTPLDPVAYFPEGVISVEGAKSADKKARAAKSKARKSKARKSRSRRAKAATRRKAQAARRARSAAERRAGAGRQSAEAVAAAIAAGSARCSVPADGSELFDSPTFAMNAFAFLGASPDDRSADNEPVCDAEEAASDDDAPVVKPRSTPEVEAPGVPVPFRGTSPVPM